MAAGIAEAILFHQMERCIGANSFDLVLQRLIAANGKQSASGERKAEPFPRFGDDQKKRTDDGDTLPVAAVGQRVHDGGESVTAQRKCELLYGLIESCDPGKIPDHREGDQTKENQENHKLDQPKGEGTGGFHKPILSGKTQCKSIQ